MTFAVALALGLVAYGTAINLVRLSDRRYVLLNVAAGVTVVSLTLRSAGVGSAAMGLDAPSSWAAVAAVAALAAGAATVPVLVRLGRRSEAVAGVLADERVRGTATRAVVGQALVRIPVGTAGFEEVAFRGALLTAFAEVTSLPVAVAASSLAFGVWHLAPTWQLLEVNRVSARAGPLALAVAGTTLGGAFLCVLRLVSGSLLVPWAVHTAFNGGGLVAAHVHQRSRERATQRATQRE